MKQTCQPYRTGLPSKALAREGFTLIEMSIVLVIIGLLVGAIFAGQVMIRAGQIRKTGKLIEQLDTAVNTFRLKYNCLPGDCFNATAFFAAAADCGGAHITGGNTVCNGDGDGDVYSIGGGRENAGNENAGFFQQIILAGLTADTRYCTINGLTCKADQSMYYWGLTIPLLGDNYSKQLYAGEGSAAIGIVNLVVANKNSNPYGINITKHHGYYMTARSWTSQGFITPYLLSALDGKFDDGYPLSGNIQAIGFVGSPISFGTGSFAPYQGPCNNTSVSPSIYYMYNDPNASGCSAMWVSGF